MESRDIFFLGLVLFILGISAMIIDVNFKSVPIMQTTEEIFVVIGFTSSGLIIIGLVIMNEITKYRYELKK